MIKTHADMQSEHYKAVRTSPMYVAEAMVDIMREELSMSMPYGNFTQSPESTTLAVKTYFSRRDRKVIDELKSEVLHYRQEIAEYMAKVDKLIASKKGKTTDYDVDDIVTIVTKTGNLGTETVT